MERERGEEDREAKVVSEIEEEERLLRERGIASPFTRGGMRRTPPKGSSTPVGAPAGHIPSASLVNPAGGRSQDRSSGGQSDEPIVQAQTEQPTPTTGRLDKRPLTSPDQVQQEKVKKRQLAGAGADAAPAAAGASASSPDLLLDPLTEAPLESVLGTATLHTRGIMEAVRSKTSKLNKDETANIGANTERLTAIVGLLVARAAAAERKLEELRRTVPSPIASASPPQVAQVTYANTLKLGKSQEARAVPVRQGPSVAVYPAADQREKLKTAADTKLVLKTAVQPAKIGITISSIRPCGNGGVIVQTGMAKAAEALKKAIPPTLRTLEPKDRMPLISLSGAEQTENFEEIIENLYEQNLEESEWTLTSLQRELKPLFRRQRGGNRCVWICQASAPLRKHLINIGRLYVGWEVVEVTDYVGVTCCRRCQQFGHPEKYCRSKSMTCGRCGEEGHKKDECKAEHTCCATCKRFNRKDAGSHVTNARECPARRHAEDRELQRINHG